MRHSTFPKSMVLVSEAIQDTHKEDVEWDPTLEMSDCTTTDEIIAALRQFVPDVTIARTPGDLIAYAEKKPLVMSVYGGEKSRNRMALVPAVCEAIGIPFMGADAYARMVCQDKYLSKIIAKNVGLESSQGLLVQTSDDLDLIKGLSLPLVVKPNLEGSSIGIGENNLVTNYNDASDLALKLLNYFKQPILVEEFIAGKEVCFCLTGRGGQINLFEAVEDIHLCDEEFFLDKIYTADLKRNQWDKMGHKCITQDVSSLLKKTLSRLYLTLGKVDYLRIDCRINNGECKLIEITPDPYMAPDGSFGQAFKMAGLDYAKGLELLVGNSIGSNEFC